MIHITVLLVTSWQDSALCKTEKYSNSHDKYTKQRIRLVGPIISRDGNKFIDTIQYIVAQIFAHTNLSLRVKQRTHNNNTTIITS